MERAKDMLKIPICRSGTEENYQGKTVAKWNIDYFPERTMVDDENGIEVVSVIWDKTNNEFIYDWSNNYILPKEDEWVKDFYK